LSTPDLYVTINVEVNIMISDNNTRTLITIPKELKSKLEELAKLDNRSFNNLVATILAKYVDENKKQSPSS